MALYMNSWIVDFRHFAVAWSFRQSVDESINDKHNERLQHRSAGKYYSTIAEWTIDSMRPICAYYEEVYRGEEGGGGERSM